MAKPSDGVLFEFDKTALSHLQNILNLATNIGGFDLALEVCKDVAKQAKKERKRDSGSILCIWFFTRYRGIDFLESKYPGCSSNFSSSTD